jgi:hypothetical protein
MKLKALAILCIILGSLLPLYALYKYLEQAMKPRKSGGRFLLWLASVFVLIFAYTFLVVLLIRLLFPGA